MSHSRFHCVSLIGLEALPVEVEVDVNVTDKFNIVIVGLPDAAVRESKDRVLTAVKNSGFSLGTIRCTINLAPGDLKKEGVLYDLPIAIGLLHASHLLKTVVDPSDYLIVGELALSGDLRSVNGGLAIALLAREQKKKGVIIPIQNAAEAALVKGIAVYGVNNLKEAVKVLENPNQIHPTTGNKETSFSPPIPPVDFADIKGQSHAKRALEIAAAGGHNVILSGPPGCGKTLMAKALVGIMPPLALEEALEVTRIHSVAGLLAENQNLITQRPFRSPHHTISFAGLIGGGTYPRPGEISLAHHGILFLDELPEFSRSVLEVLRQPLEDRKVTISRANGSLTFPTNVMCIAAMNPCPCGYLGHPEKPCKDSPLQVERYKGKISGPLWDRLDISITVLPVRFHELANQSNSESSALIRQRVENARTWQSNRYGSTKTNAQLSTAELKKFCTLNTAGWASLQVAIETLGLSARACDRIIRVSRTIADLAQSEQIEEPHLLEALTLRS